MRRLAAALAAAVVARMAFHALYLPAFEGPDEPQHLARMLDFATRPLATAFAGRTVSPEILAAVRAYPCRAGLHAVLGCPEYGSRRAAFDLLAPRPVAATGGLAEIPNVEANQPPLYYAAAGLLLRPFAPAAASALLASRLLSVFLVAVALFGPLRRLSRTWPPGLAAAGLIALLAPGAAEGLARSSNDAAVFCWASFAVAAVVLRARTVWVVALLAAGPLIKLTAFPIVVFAVAALAAERRIAAALAGAAESLAVFPIQWARGWRWGGTLELNAVGPPVGEPLAHAALGLARSAYAFVKTAFWIGGSSLLRPPIWLTVLWILWLGGLALAFASRRRLAPVRAEAHAAAAVAALCGFVVFAYANRRYYGVWGGVGGWYLWGWSPWIAQAAADLGAARERVLRAALPAGLLIVVAANAVWLAATWRLFG